MAVIFDTETDVTTWIAQHQRKDLLRFLTCGSVDDGKSTLIGRMLYETDSVYEDHITALRRDSTKHGTTGQGNIDLALLTDGLKAEREQGITIDVAYRYFSTAKRKFIIADCPGHEQYTRNMATGASGCDLAIILMDARPGHGLMPQTRRHSSIVTLLGIRHVVLAINKMDCVAWSQARFDELEREYRAFAATLGMHEITCIPLSALTGGNVVERTADTPWYAGPSLLEHLESVPVTDAVNRVDLRFPVQYVIRPDLNFRGFAGTVASGVVRVGDALRILPARTEAVVKRLVTHDGDLSEAHAGMPVVICLDREVDASRGDMFIAASDTTTATQAVIADVVWMHEEPLLPGHAYVVRTASGFVSGTVRRIVHQTDLTTQQHQPADRLELNRIGRIELSVARPLVLEPYTRNRVTGAFVLVDRLHHATVGAGMVVSAIAGGHEDAGHAVRLAAAELVAALRDFPASALDASTRAALDQARTALDRATRS